MLKPRLLDLFCGAGGASAGYYKAGFEITGVDINLQPNYPFRFLKKDVTTLTIEFLQDFDIIHASPPCQYYSYMSSCRPNLASKYPDLIPSIRSMLVETGNPYIIENVVGSPLIDPIMLCGKMFNFDLYRHRLFESNLGLKSPSHIKHTVPTSKAGHWEPGTVMSVAGHIAPISHAKKIMGINWMTRDELVEAIPPYYTEYIGTQIMNFVYERY